MPSEFTSARTSSKGASKSKSKGGSARAGFSKKKSSSTEGKKRSFGGSKSAGARVKREDSDRTPALGRGRNLKRSDGSSQPRGERSQSRDRDNNRGERSERSPRGERSDRSRSRDRDSSRNDRSERSPRGERDGYAPRGERSDRGGRGERNDRSPRGERSERGSRDDRGGYRGGRGERSGGGFRSRDSGGFRQRGHGHGGRSAATRGGGGGGRGRYGSKMKALDPKLFMNDVVEITPEMEVHITNTFKDFGFDERLEANIIKKGYITPTPIQDQTIVHAMEGRDILGMANTGTGKTAAFTLPIINALTKFKDQRTRALVIAPTRELAQQIEQEFRSFSPGMRMFSTLCVGGLSIHKQKVQLRRDPHVVIGTPGRLKDLINQGVLDLSDISMFVLDEVDLMLDMGFIDDIRDIVSEIPEERQTLFFSATMTDTIKTLIKTIMKDPVTVSVKTGDTSANVQQDVIYSKSSKEKWDSLMDMFADQDFEKVLIFCETKSFVQRLCDDLNDNGVKADAIHGDKSQPQRQRALRKFKENNVQVLVATDVAARGLDIPNVSHVINYDTPRAYDDYVHRIGRTGRAGKLGKAITFVKG
jgi:ATP-dependent RNA helicase RhlE